MILYVIYDKIADEFGPILEAKNDMVAARSYASVVKPNMAHDYDLYAVGERVSGDIEKVIVAYDSPRKVDIAVKFSKDGKLAVVEVDNVKSDI